MKQVIDNFSAGSADYIAFRPESPKEIFEFIDQHTICFDAAWDCGTGNGQVASKLAEKFKLVYGTDISEEQMSLAPKRDNIIYLKERAEQTSLKDNSINLIAIAQAIHWFDFEQFYAEVRRVAKTGGLIAAWAYSTPKLTSTVDKVIDYFYEDITGPYWDKERAYVDHGYSTIPFPFKEIIAPEMAIVKHWNMQQLLGYLRTWSGVKHYVKKHGIDPTLLILDQLKQAWGTEDLLKIFWPVHVRAGRVD